MNGTQSEIENPYAGAIARLTDDKEPEPASLGPDPAKTLTEEAKKFGLKTGGRLQGKRTREQQERLVREGKTKARNSYHLYEGNSGALDFSGDPEKMREFTQHLRDTYGNQLPELFHGDLAWKNGRRIPAVPHHENHAHVAWGQITNPYQKAVERLQPPKGGDASDTAEPSAGSGTNNKRVVPGDASGQNTLNLAESPLEPFLGVSGVYAEGHAPPSTPEPTPATATPPSTPRPDSRSALRPGTGENPYAAALARLQGSAPPTPQAPKPKPKPQPRDITPQEKEQRDAFEADKTAGNLMAARQRGHQMARHFGWEYGEQDGWPYIRPPAHVNPYRTATGQKEVAVEGKRLPGAKAEGERKAAPPQLSILQRAGRVAESFAENFGVKIPHSWAEAGKEAKEFGREHTPVGQIIQAVEGFSKGDLQGIREGMEHSLFALTPYKPIVDILKAHGQELKAGYDQWVKEGAPDVPSYEVTKHILAGAVPIFGPPAKRALDQLEKGDYEGAAGTGLFLVAIALGPKALKAARGVGFEGAAATEGAALSEEIGGFEPTAEETAAKGLGRGPGPAEEGLPTAEKSLGPTADKLRPIDEGSLWDTPTEKSLGRSTGPVRDLEDIPRPPSINPPAAGQATHTVQMVDAATGQIITREVSTSVSPADAYWDSFLARAQKLQQTEGQGLLKAVTESARRQGLGEQVRAGATSAREAVTGLADRIKDLYQKAADRLGTKAEQLTPADFTRAAAAALRTDVSRGTKGGDKDERSQRSRTTLRQEPTAGAQEKETPITRAAESAQGTKTKESEVTRDAAKEGQEPESRLREHLRTTSRTAVSEDEGEVQEEEGPRPGRRDRAGTEAQIGAEEVAQTQRKEDQADEEERQRERARLRARSGDAREATPDTAQASRAEGRRAPSEREGATREGDQRPGQVRVGITPGATVSHPDFASGKPLRIDSVEGDDLTLTRLDTGRKVTIKADSRIGRELKPVSEGEIVSQEPARVTGVPGAIRRERDERRRVAAEAATDKLTGLQSQSQWLAARPRIEADPNLHITRLDINGLKAVNDRDGHDAGDAYISAVAKIIQEESRNAGIPDRMQFRSGRGDEFSLAGTPADLRKVAGAIQSRVQREVGLPDGTKGSVAIGTGPKEKIADNLMYRDKERSKRAEDRPSLRTQTKPGTVGDRVYAAGLRRTADAMDSQIESKLHSAIGEQRPTPRRARIAEGMRREGERLQTVQATMRALADAHEAGTVDRSLSKVRTRADVETVLQYDTIPAGNWAKAERDRLARLGITNPSQAHSANAALKALIAEKPKESDTTVEIRRAEAALIGRKIPGFFPTPRATADKMVEMADIRSGMNVLEPSAGSGNIAEAIREGSPDANLSVIEYSSELGKILTLKGFDVVGQDFLAHNPGPVYDRIVMNPPFEKLQDIDHVRHAFNLLKPGGRLVSITSESPFFRSDKKAAAFRDWVDGLGGESEKLEAGTFSKQAQATGVRGRIITIDKPITEPAKAEATIKPGVAAWKSANPAAVETLSGLAKSLGATDPVSRADKVIANLISEGLESPTDEELGRRMTETFTGRAPVKAASYKPPESDKTVLQAASAGTGPEHKAWQAAVSQIESGDTSAGAIQSLRTAGDALGLSPATVNRIEDLAKEVAGETTKGTSPEAAPAGREGEGREVPATRQPKGAVARGKETRVRIPGQAKAYAARYQVQELSDIYPSHNAVTFQANPDYHFVNDRDYSNPLNQSRVIENAQTGKFDPAYLVTDTPTATDGPPVIDQAGNVLGGNNRTMTLARVYGENPEGAKAYRDLLTRNFRNFGLDLRALQGMNQPVLVRVLDDADIQAQAAITELNVVGTAALTQSEQAISDARRVPESAIDYITGKIDNLGEEGTLAKVMEGKGGVDVVNRLVSEGVFTEQERPRLIDDRGLVTKEAKDRIGRLLIGHVFRDLDQLENTSQEIRNKLERIIAPLARVSNNPAWDLTNTVNGAVDALREAKAHGIKNLDDLARQQTMFGPGAYSPAEMAIAKKLQEGPIKAAKAFRSYAQDEANARVGQGTLLGPPPEQRESFARHFDVEEPDYQAFEDAIREEIPQVRQMPAEDYNRVVAKLEAIKRQAKVDKQPLSVAIQDFLDQKGLFGGEFNEAQASLLRELGARGRRAAQNAEQGSLFDTSPTLESETEKRGQADRGVQFPIGGLFEEVAWHGSPYKFDKFTLQHMGAGSGAQSFGWGLYFAEKKDVAQYYRQMVAKREASAELEAKLSGALNRFDWLGFDSPGQALTAIRQNPDWKTRWDISADTQEDREAIKTIEQYVTQGTRLYKVDLAPKEDEYLVWDKPLAEQSQKVQTALQNASITKDAYGETAPHVTGQRIYDQINFESEGSDEAASKKLLAAGIRGIKYLDQGSRAVGRGTYNYVIFDDADIAIQEVMESTAPRGWSEVEAAPIEPAQFAWRDRRGYLALNNAATTALHIAYHKPVKGLAVTAQNARQIAANADKAAEVGREAKPQTPGGRQLVRNMESLATAMRDAASRRSQFGIVTAASPKMRATIRHESAHVAQLALERFFKSAPAESEIYNIANYKAAAEGMIEKRGYTWIQNNPRAVAHEAAAHIAGGQWDLLGMTRAEATEFLTGYFELISRTYNRPEALKVFDQLNNSFKELRDNVIARETERRAAARPGSTARPAEGRVQGIPVGRQESAQQASGEQGFEDLGFRAKLAKEFGLTEHEGQLFELPKESPLTTEHLEAIDSNWHRMSETQRAAAVSRVESERDAQIKAGEAIAKNCVEFGGRYSIRSH